MFPRFKKLLLIVLDGFGVASNSSGNAITRGNMRAFNSLVNHFPSMTLQAAGPNVGLPWSEPGNSEVGHMCLGAGRIVLQDLPRINRAISSGEYYKNPAFNEAIDHALKNNSALHIIGLLGDGEVHASQLHTYSLMNLAAVKGVQKVILHPILDGRDTQPDAALGYMNALEKKIIEIGIGKIASISGRFYAMDRALHWDLTEKYYKAITAGQADAVPSALGAIQSYYDQSIFDETIPPTLILQPGQKPDLVSSNDAVIITNFRADRVIQLARALVDPGQCGFAEKYQKIDNLKIVTMTEYSHDLSAISVAFPRVAVANTLSEFLSKQNKKQYHISEAEKFPHVTYFFSNGNEHPFAGETWDQVKSNTNYQERYQNVPEMAARELTDKLLAKLSEPFDFFLVNYPNPDMVGHTGSLSASIKAVEAVDACVEQLVKYALAAGDMAVLITADHGNCESVHDAHTGRIRKAHTTNPVPLVLAGAGLKLAKSRAAGYLYLATQVPDGLLSDVAPTVLDLMGIVAPPEMTGISLVSNFEKQLTGK